jgi:hypothetical protein
LRKGCFISVARIATLVILPFTGVVMMPTNKELMRLAKEGLEEQGMVSESNGATILSKWNKMNCIRAVLPMI